MTQRGEPLGSVELEGFDGEGCVALIRNALSLSWITGRSFTIHWANDSAGLPSDGATAISIAAATAGAATGASIGSREVTFEPRALKGGAIRFDSGASPVAPLVQMFAAPLSFASAPSTIRAVGATHSNGAASFHDLALGWWPAMERLGLTGEVSLEAAGFAPQGGGILNARIFPAPRLRAADLSQRGMLLEVHAIALVANLGVGIALPLERRLTERLRGRGIAAQVEALPMPVVDKARGLAVVVAAQFERTRVAFVGVGENGNPPEKAADEAVDRFAQFLERRGAVEGAAAEQLLAPLAIAASSFGAPGAIRKEAPGASRVSVSRVTGGLLAVADAARRFLDVDIQIQGLPEAEGVIDIRPRPIA